MPDYVTFVDTLPRTATGMIMKVVLCERTEEVAEPAAP
ncbi:long-chain fatty acid--CoA ligase [Cryobacterium ruanii]|nr:long-chain fatty acid--CoA ligase [Cryobacterium ruanii]